MFGKLSSMVSLPLFGASSVVSGDNKNQSSSSKKKKIRIGLIGAGPSGLSLLNAFHKELERLNKNGQETEFELIVFEKQKEIGGLWNYNWRTGTNEYGIPVHASQYRHLWSNGPKECLEMCDYTFKQHYKDTNIGSFPPRPVLQDYIMGRVKANNLENKFDIRLNHNIIHVDHINENGDGNFKVFYQDLKNNKSGSEEFDYLCVATGHFSVPNIPEFKGFDLFNGRIIHSHDFRNATQFKNQHVFVIGSSYSAEDIALQTWKMGAKKVTISYRTAPMDFKWPRGIKEVPLLKEIMKNGKDGKLINGDIIKDIDSIILCTGYLHSFPFLPNQLTLKTKNCLYPKGLYKGVVWMNNPNLFYLGMQDQWYTFTMFDLQGLFVRDAMLNKIKLPTKSAMIKDAEKWIERSAECKSDDEQIRFQTDYIQDLWRANADYAQEYVDDVDKLDYSEVFHQWEHDKDEDILSYRNKCFTSKVSGIKSIPAHTLWRDAMDDSKDAYVYGGK